MAEKRSASIDQEMVEDMDKHHHATDGTNDLHAGVEANEYDSAVPPGYWYSYEFVGSMVGIALLGNSLFIGYAMPVSPDFQGHRIITLIGRTGKCAQHHQRGHWTER
jgi:hypothetical protein